jgi:hypothetical protein
MIIESIVTTMDPSGRVNCAPMGVEWGEGAIVIKPFLETTTFRNLMATGVAVVNLTDDVMLFALGATEPAEFPWTAARRIRGAVLDAACSWRELEVIHADTTPPRSRFEMRVVHSEERRPFLGFNRARHAVLEAAILATRTHLIPVEEITREMTRLQVLVDKTAGPREREAMSRLTDAIRSRLERPPSEAPDA